MRSLSFVALALFSVTLVTASCGSSDQKLKSRGEEAGGGGEAGDGSDGQLAAGGGSELPAGGAPPEATAGAPDSAGNGASGEASGGAAGAAPLTLESLEGDWIATSLSTYACESSIQSFGLKIDGSSVTIPGWPYGLDGSGTIAAQDGGAFTLQLEYEQTSEFSRGTILGQFFVDPSARYALMVTQELDSTNDVNNGYFAILQHTTTRAPEITTNDFLGDWAGTNLRLDQQFAATAMLTGSGTFSPYGETVTLTGTDADGDFSSQGNGAFPLELPAVGLEPIEQNDAAYASAFLMSPDKRALAGMWLTHADGSAHYGLCDQQIFADLRPHKFTLWTKSE